MRRTGASSEDSGLSVSGSAVSAAVDGMIGPRGTEEGLCGARHRCGELGIVRAAPDDSLPLDQNLILSIQIKTRLDCDGATCADPPIMSRRGRKIADCSSGIGVQLECPFDAIGRSAAGRSRLEAPLAKPCLCHVQGQVALQFAGVESRETVRRFDLQCHRRGGDRRSKRKYCDRRRQSAEQDSWVETYPARQI